MAALKLAVTSDLYYPVTSPDLLTTLARQMAAFEPDAVVLAGDLADSLSDFNRCLKLFRDELRCPVWVLPGDHDFWARPPYDSHALWQKLLPEAVAAAGCRWLEGKSFSQNGVAVAGTVGWYDYSAALMAGMMSDMEFAQQKYLHNADALRIDWEWSDPEFASRVGAALLATLDQIEQAPDVSHAVVVTHFPLFDGQIVRRPGSSFACAYSGNLTLGRKVLSRKKVSHVISGHVHADLHGEVRRDGLPGVEFHVIPGDYDRPAWYGLTV